jgi:predicted unusual protein kinase regulating ubiquinone biosynthesis (AarF/ABC1/UbiB family)/nucleotide-binding universal stress UspA family protein
MSTTSEQAPAITRVMVATDRSRTATRAVRWGATLADSTEAELLLINVLPPTAVEADVELAHQQLQEFAQELAGDRGRSHVVLSDDPAQALIDVAESDHADVLVVGNVGMAGRKQFLLGNIPNRISHNARCTVVIVNTRVDEDDGAPQPNGRRPQEEADVEEALFGRAWHIGRIVAGAGLREMLDKTRAPDGASMRAAAVRFRETLDKLGPTFAKLGQILSTRPDLLPPEFVDELSNLQERVTPLTESEVVAVMEKELGVPWEDVFESIDPVPLAAGTIAQVHRATLESGDRVVVKVQRPTAEADILQDLGLLEMFATKAADRPALRKIFDVPVMIQHLSESLRRELDFRGEAEHIDRMREVLAPFPQLDVPQVYHELSTSRFLVMQEIPGVSIYEAPHSRARSEAARQLFESYCHQVMVEGFFHADPHPGNMKWWNDTIYFLDLGMVGELDSQLRQLVLLMLLAFAQKDASFLSQIVLTIASPEGAGGVSDPVGFQEALSQLIERYRDLPLREIRFGPMLEEVTKIAASYELRLPAALMLTGKALAQVQMAAATLDPELDPFSVAEAFFLRSGLRRVFQRFDAQSVFYEGQKLRFQLTRIIEVMEGIVGIRPGSHLQVDFRGTDRLEDTISRASKRLSVSLAVSSTILGAAMVLRAGLQRAGEPDASRDGLASFAGKLFASRKR